MGLRLHGRLTQVRPAREDDADLLVAWHADPDVSRYWDDETFTRDEMLERLRRPGVDAYVVEAGDAPIGYLQAWWDEDQPRRGGIDMFLVPSARGRGFGPDAARALTESLLASGWTCVTVDPYAWNEAAIRAWRRAGFVELERRGADEEHTSAWVLMEFQSASGSS
jgi:aminoglycoside 6'-N-acetyltransferase